MDHAHDFHALIANPVQDQVIAERQPARFGRDLRPRRAKLRMFLKLPATCDDAIDQPVGGRGVVARDMKPDVVEIGGCASCPNDLSHAALEPQGAHGRGV
jgi:hypothetical protein